ncbi:unnamed protein product [Didymodactylos carnosus]|uniref:Major facilitator superfamily (MFS) profile domain-containing protein n=1 Tax=Didymodactylos carnosus TaxID=1234261 RepID=A0A814N4R3_9BILA|nr:unnamed protein product [Didymodactylos carnosus]CAF3852234.1 unnamed protein product [Didymodactylos carnosus]
MSIRVPGNVQELVWLQELPLRLVHGQTFEGDMHFIYINHTLQANRLLLYILTLIIAGSATALEPLLALKFGHHLFLHITYAVIFGFSTGEYIGITSVVAVDLVGLEKFSDAFGLVLVVQGVAIAFGLPIVGVLNDELGSYLIPYVIVGVVITLSGVVLFLIPLIKRWQQSSATTNKSLTTSHEIDDMNTTSVNLT